MNNRSEELVAEECALVKKEFEKVPEGYEPFILNASRIIQFLANIDSVSIQLKKLNALLLEKAKDMNFSFNENNLKGYIEHKKILRNVLEEELKKLGFKPYLAKAIDYLPPEIFRTVIRDGLIIKDPGAGLNHGEFTHAIQWLLIGWQQNDTAFLNKPVIEIFQQFGDDRSVFKKFVNSEEWNMWDLVVDAPYPEVENCRSPEFLHRLILESTDKELSFLNELCASRYLKRFNSQVNDRFFSSKKYPNEQYKISDENNNLLIPITTQL